MDDLVLWRLFLNGDKESFRQIYAIYYQHLYSYGIRKFKHPELVRDSIQDVFVNLWIKRSTLSDTANIKFYLLAALRNQLVNLSLQGSRYLRIELNETEQFQLDIDPESILIQREHLTAKAKKVIDALEQLTSRQREVLYLHYFEAMSHEEIAQLLNLSIKGVYKLKYRGLDALRIVLGVSKSDLLILLAACKLEILVNIEFFEVFMKKT